MKQNSSQGIRGGSRCLDRLVGVGIGTIMVSTGVLSLRVAVRWVGGWNRYYYAE